MVVVTMVVLAGEDWWLWEWKRPRSRLVRGPEAVVWDREAGAAIPAGSMVVGCLGWYGMDMYFRDETTMGAEQVGSKERGRYVDLSIYLSIHAGGLGVSWTSNSASLECEQRSGWTSQVSRWEGYRKEGQFAGRVVAVDEEEEMVAGITQGFVATISAGPDQIVSEFS